MVRPWNATVISYRTAIFRQINKDKRATITMRWNFQTAKSFF